MGRPQRGRGGPRRYPSAIDEYTFLFVPLSGGNVKGKLYLTCLPKKVQRARGHRHAWKPKSLDTVSSATPVPSGAPDTYSNSGLLQTTPCLPGEISVSPGFEFTGTDTWGKPYLRAATSGTALRQWDWGFFTTTGGTVKLYWRCLPKKTGFNAPAAPGRHHHRLVTNYRTKVQPATVARDAVNEHQAICGSHYKAMLGAWDFGYTGLRGVERRRP